VSPILEVCAFNIQSCIIAANNGAARIELCADPLHGGTTPSCGLIDYAIHKIAIPVFPMIRPRGGNFVYDADEIEIMRKDILKCRDLGCTGIATGMLLPDGRIDKDLLGRIVEWAYPMQVTSHKAFDAVPDACQALEDIIAAGCARVLTSGLQPTAAAGAPLIARLIAQADGRIIIMPGGGIRAAGIAQLAADTSASEFHSSAILTRGVGDIADEQEVKALVTALAHKA